MGWGNEGRRQETKFEDSMGEKNERERRKRELYIEESKWVADTLLEAEKKKDESETNKEEKAKHKTIV